MRFHGKRLRQLAAVNHSYHRTNRPGQHPVVKTAAASEPDTRFRTGHRRRQEQQLTRRELRRSRRQFRARLQQPYFPATSSRSRSATSTSSYRFRSTR